MQYDANWQTQQEPAPYGANPAHGIVFAIAAIALGALFLINNLGIAPLHDVARYWPVIPIALGFVLLVDSRTMPATVSGGMLIGAAALLLLANLHVIALAWRVLWPAIPIALGVLTLLCSQPRGQRPVLHR